MGMYKNSHGEKCTILGRREMYTSELCISTVVTSICPTYDAVPYLVQAEKKYGGHMYVHVAS